MRVWGLAVSPLYGATISGKGGLGFEIYHLNESHLPMVVAAEFSKAEEATFFEDGDEGGEVTVMPFDDEDVELGEKAGSGEVGEGIVFGALAIHLQEFLVSRVASDEGSEGVGGGFDLEFFRCTGG
jgi:hypothetical protein